MIKWGMEGTGDCPSLVSDDEARVAPAIAGLAPGG